MQNNQFMEQNSFSVPSHGTPNLIPHGTSLENYFSAQQEIIYQFLLDLVKNQPPEVALAEFRHLFIECANSTSASAMAAVYELLITNSQVKFLYTFKRCCYILINNWYSAREYGHIQDLIDKIQKTSEEERHFSSRSLRRSQSFIKAFVSSQDYQDLKIFSASLFPQKDHIWQNRYAHYLLLDQSANSDNSFEQRQSAAALSKKLKNEYLKSLAFYTARNPHSQVRQTIENPTILGDQMLDLVKYMTNDHVLDYKRYAQMFMGQSQNISHGKFKQNLLIYLTHYDQSISNFFVEKMTARMASIYPHRGEETIDSKLVLQTCKKIIRQLTTEDDQQPAELFNLLLMQGQFLSLAIMLLRIILICKHARKYLDLRIVSLIKYYQNCSSQDCQPFIIFLEVFTLLCSLFDENITYNLIDIPSRSHSKNQAISSKIDASRIYSQFRGADLRNVDLSGADLRCADLKGANLCEAKLDLANLSGANLGFANLSRASLKGAILTGAELIAANLEGANLTAAKLAGANFSHGQLASVDLSGAQLNDANLSEANLQGAILISATGTGTSFYRASLIAAALNDANFQKANLTQVDLSHGNLVNIKLNHSSLDGAQLLHANLNGANLYCASLKRAQMIGAQLSRGFLRSTNFEMANLERAILTESFLRGANLSQANCSSANFSQSDLSRADLGFAQFKGARFRYAQLRHATLSRADFSDVDFSGSNLFDADLLQAKVTNACFRAVMGLPQDILPKLQQQGAVL